MSYAWSYEPWLSNKRSLAKGKFTFDEENDLYFGRPLVDAYLLHDELYYYGIVAHHSIESLIKNIKNRFAIL